MSAMKDFAIRMQEDGLIRSIEEGQILFESRYDEFTAKARHSFRDYKPEARAEAIQNALCDTWENFASLIERALANDTLLTTTFYFACKRTRSGRDASKIKSTGHKELFNHARQHNSIDMDAFVSDRDSVFTHVAFKIDTQDWLDRLPANHRTRALALASGESPSDLAIQWGISRAAVSIEKRYLESSYASFIGGDA